MVNPPSEMTALVGPVEQCHSDDRASLAGLRARIDPSRLGGESMLRAGWADRLKAGGMQRNGRASLAAVAPHHHDHAIIIIFQ
jgi:hypothetical protein